MQSERLPVALADEMEEPPPAFRWRLAWNLQVGADAAVGRKTRRFRRGDHAGQTMQARQQRLEKALLLGGGRVGAARKWQPCDEDVVWIETEIDALQSDESTDEQPGTHQQDQRQRDLGDDERVAQPPAAEPGADAFARVLERLDDVAARRHRRGSEAEQQHREQRGAQAEEQYRHVQTDQDLTRNRALW